MYTENINVHNKLSVQFVTNMTSQLHRRTKILIYDKILQNKILKRI